MGVSYTCFLENSIFEFERLLLVQILIFIPVADNEELFQTLQEYHAQEDYHYIMNKLTILHPKLLILAKSAKCDNIIKTVETLYGYD